MNWNKVYDGSHEPIADLIYYTALHKHCIFTFLSLSTVTIHVHRSLSENSLKNTPLQILHGKSTHIVTKN